ncbi:MAG: hypothetical protein K6A81_07455 [Clostridiales bacterium]|nr:hypothetical protein [Clostridiales bacterium]
MKGKLKKRIIAAFVILLLILMIVPVRGRLSDGGSVYYNAVLYEVRFVHKREIGPYGEPERLTEGTIVKILGFKIYDNTESRYTGNIGQSSPSSVQTFNEVSKAQFNVYYTDLYLSSYMSSDEFRHDSKETRQEKMVKLLQELIEKGFVVQDSIKAESLDSIVYEIEGFGVVLIDYDSLST